MLLSRVGIELQEKVRLRDDLVLRPPVVDSEVSDASCSMFGIGKEQEALLFSLCLGMLREEGGLYGELPQLGFSGNAFSLSLWSFKPSFGTGKLNGLWSFSSGE